MRDRATTFSLRDAGAEADALVPESRNPAELPAALRFGAFYAVVLFAPWRS